MLRLIHRIEIDTQAGQVVLDHTSRGVAVSEVEVYQNWDDNMGTARIVFPRNVELEGKRITGSNSDLFQVGNAVRIALGYSGVLGGGYPAVLRKWVFAGYVTKVLPKAPIELECMDAMWSLQRKKPYTETVKELSFQKLIDSYQKLYAEFNWEVVPEGFDFVIPELRVNNATPFKVLDKLKQDYGIQWMFKPRFEYRGRWYPSKLYIGQLHLGQLWRTAESSLRRPEILTDAHFVEDNLEYQRKDDTRIRVLAWSLDTENNERIREYGGDPTGDLRTIWTMDLSREELKKFADQEAQKFKYTGYTGDFTCFGEPYVRPGDAVNLKDRFGLKPEGRYQVKAVRHRFGNGNGWKQDIELEREV